MGQDVARDIIREVKIIGDGKNWQHESKLTRERRIPAYDSEGFPITNKNGGEGNRPVWCGYMCEEEKETKKQKILVGFYWSGAGAFADRLDPNLNFPSSPRPQVNMALDPPSCELELPVRDRNDHAGETGRAGSAAAAAARR